jgi:hypothetical protein
VRELKNTNYNLVTALSERLKGLALYDTFLEDARSDGFQECEQLWQELRELDEQAEEKLQQHVADKVRQDQFS